MTIRFGADDQIRTDYLVLTKDALYLLSYISISSVPSQEALPQGTNRIITHIDKKCKPFLKI